MEIRIFKPEIDVEIAKAQLEKEGEFSFVMAQPMELLLLQRPIAPRLARVQTAQRARVLATLRKGFRTDSLAAAAHLSRLDSAAQLLAIGVQQARAKQQAYEAARLTDWRLGAAVRAAAAQEHELLAQLAAVQATQQLERQATVHEVMHRLFSNRMLARCWRDYIFCTTSYPGRGY